MKLFMGNPCGYGNCMRTDCENCCHYTPTIFGIKVPKWLASIGFWIEYHLIFRRSIRKWQKSLDTYESEGN